VTFAPVRFIALRLLGKVKRNFPHGCDNMPNIVVRLEKKEVELDDIRRFVELLDVFAKLSIVHTANFSTRQHIFEHVGALTDNLRNAHEVFLRETAFYELKKIADSYIDSYILLKTNNAFCHSIVMRRGIGEVFTTCEKAKDDYRIKTRISYVTSGSVEIEIAIETVSGILAGLILLGINRFFVVLCLSITPD